MDPSNICPLINVGNTKFVLMDSLTHIVFGAALGEVVLGKKLGKKALLLGAVGATLPDFDVLYNFFDHNPIGHLRAHRSYTHAVLTQIMAALPLAWFSLRKISSDITSKNWYFFWFAALITHSLLDSCTNYGTRLFLPFSTYQVAFNNISVIDPLYTLPFLILFLIALCLPRHSKSRRRLFSSAVIVSSCYFLLTFYLKYQAQQIFRNNLTKIGIAYDELNTTPTMLNSVLWSAVAYNDSMVYASEYSFFKKEEPIRWVPFKRNSALIKGYCGQDIETIKWFGDGSWFVKSGGKDTLSFYVTKFGRSNFETNDADSSFIFHWKVIKKNGITKVEQAAMPRSGKDISAAFHALTRRIGL